jgi:hypothetical protein
MSDAPCVERAVVISQVDRLARQVATARRSVGNGGIDGVRTPARVHRAGRAACKTQQAVCTSDRVAGVEEQLGREFVRMRDVTPHEVVGECQHGGLAP